jgi:cytochrome c553
MSACQQVQALTCVMAMALVLSSALPVSAAALEEKLAACLACHGASGRAGHSRGTIPRRQPVFYLTIQLLMFRDKLRIVEPMNQAMQGLRDDDLRNIAVYLAKLPPPKPVGGPIEQERMERARALIEEHRCNFCHQGNFSGEQNVPRLAGQLEDYPAKAMREYKNNTRRGYDAAMADVLYPISDEQIGDLAYFLARLR